MQEQRTAVLGREWMQDSGGEGLDSGHANGSMEAPDRQLTSLLLKRTCDHGWYVVPVLHFTLPKFGNKPAVYNLWMKRFSMGETLQPLPPQANQAAASVITRRWVKYL
jgi:hypothetical protein